MLTRDFSWRVKAADTGVFTGIASPYGDPPDLQGDVIQRGAFAQAIKGQPTAGYPVLWHHNQTEPVGVGRISDSAAGLLIDGTLFLDDPAARRAHTHLKGGSIRGLSIGYLPPKGDKVSYRDDGTRIIHEVHLMEVSLVSVPASPRAQLTSVKSVGDIRHVLKSLRDKDVTEDVIAELLAIDLELKRLLPPAEDPAEKAKAETLRQLQAFAGDMKRFTPCA